jgi:uncharacterized protein YlxW (UPF0749 family)
MPDAVPQSERLPEHVTTPLLTLLTARSMDEDYAHVAARREPASPAPAGGRRPGWATLAVVGAFGLLVSVAAVQTSRDAEVDELGRAALLSQIESQRAEVGALQKRVADLSRVNQTASARNAELVRRLREVTTVVERLEVPTGFTAVRGDGIRITLDNAPGADGTTEIRDEDLATLVDGLWEAGAEAIAVDEQRLNALGGIRNTGRAVHVNGSPVQAPYVVSAIGDRATLQARLQATSQGQEFLALANGLGFQYEIDNVDDVRLPAATLRPLRDAVEVDAGPGGEEVAP